MKKIILGVIVIIIVTSAYFWSVKKTAPVIEGSAVATTTNIKATAAEPITFEMQSGGFYFEPKVLKAKVGQKVTVRVEVAGGMHTFTIDEFGLDVKTPGGKITEVTFTPTKKGSFVFYCAMAGHRAKGQWGTLTVE